MILSLAKKRDFKKLTQAITQLIIEITYTKIDTFYLHLRRKNPQEKNL